MPSDLVYCYSFLSQNQVSIYALYVMESGKQRCLANQNWGPERRPYYLFMQIISGQGEITIGKHQYSVRANDVLLTWPNDAVSFHSSLEAPLEYAWVGFKGNDSAMLLAQTNLSRLNPLINIPQSEKMIAYMEEIYQHRGHQSENATSMNGYLYLYLSELIHAKYAGLPVNDSAKAVIEQAVSYIVTHYSQKITETQLAQSVSVSRSWLYRSFVRYLGASPMRYINEYRVEQAGILLRDPSVSIANVARAVGFSDPFYFSKVFKKLKGVSPSEYRAQVSQFIKRP